MNRHKHNAPLNRADKTVIVTVSLHGILSVALLAGTMASNHSQGNDAAGKGMAAGLAGIMVIVILMALTGLALLVNHWSAKKVSRDWISLLYWVPLFPPLVLAIPALVMFKNAPVTQPTRAPSMRRRVAANTEGTKRVARSAVNRRHQGKAR